MSVDELQKRIDSFEYWDARVRYLDCNYLADEIVLAYEFDELDVVYSFIGCYKSVFDHVKNYDKLRPVKDMTIPQIPYFMQNVEVGNVLEEGVHFFTCKINMFPLYVEIWCKDIEITTKSARLLRK